MSARPVFAALIAVSLAARAQHAGHDMSQMGHAMQPPPAEATNAKAPPASATPAPSPDPHAAHTMQGMDHSMHDMPTMDMSQTKEQAAPYTPVPVPTDADRAAAFAPLTPHAMHDREVHLFTRVDRLEVDDGEGAATEITAWLGGDVNRAWLRAKGRTDAGRLEHASVELLYGRLVAPWWDVVAGVRHDTGGGPSRNWAAIGVQGVTPYKIELRATGYVGDSGRTAARVEAEYDTLLTNRWILQWRAEADAYGRDDPARGLGSGLSSFEAGARLRYEITREFAPYLGVEVEHAYGDTATFRRAHDEDAHDTRIVAGLRLVF
ncbi:copper resistance protein B [Lysobacter sp. TY2-98]|uniref:copper resistance protein B n=1 Tax=Lysobacter sp. TY2-98 TaxID=2290922 RepID=UPI000E20859C|nr:copper resistance protein B [Lysobacter sp. TY2-98]AXK73241.1 copper resistance protein B [Lysobacter sp. TY2-98]